jgi:ribosome-binding protein aMBF1 (putative translation factor)
VVGKYGRQAFYVHRLVIKAFRGPPSSKLKSFVAHINGNNQDNRLKNLRWSTKEENEADKKEHGTSPAGQNNPGSKLTWDIVKQIRNMKQLGESTSSLSKKFKVSEQQIRSIVSNRAWVE